MEDDPRFTAACRGRITVDESTGGGARFTIEIPADQRPGMDLDEQQIVLSRDGTRVAWIGARAPTRRIYTRAIDELDIRAVPGTEDVENQVLELSPDGAWVAYQKLDGSVWRDGVP